MFKLSIARDNVTEDLSIFTDTFLIVYGQSIPVPFRVQICALKCVILLSFSGKLSY